MKNNEEAKAKEAAEENKQQSKWVHSLMFNE